MKNIENSILTTSFDIIESNADKSKYFDSLYNYNIGDVVFYHNAGNGYTMPYAEGFFRCKKQRAAGSVRIPAPINDDNPVTYNTEYWEEVKEFYIKYSNGLIIAWGNDINGLTSKPNIKFPIIFKNIPSVIITPYNLADNDTIAQYKVLTLTPSEFTASGRYRGTGTSSGTINSRFNWLAIGF